MKKLLFLPLLALVFLASCDPVETGDPEPLYRDYFPAGEGFTYIYQVDSVVYSFFDTSTVDTFRYQLRERYTNPFTDDAGELAYIVERHVRADSAQPWQIQDVWVLNSLPYSVEKVEENQRLVKLVFPVRDGRSWDAGAYLPDAELLFRYDSVHFSGTVAGNTYDSLVTVVERLDSNLINRVREVELYAWNVGLVHHYDRELEYQPDPEDPNKGMLQGYIYSQRLLEFTTD